MSEIKLEGNLAFLSPDFLEQNSCYFLVLFTDDTLINVRTVWDLATFLKYKDEKFVYDSSIYFHYEGEYYSYIKSNNRPNDFEFNFCKVSSNWLPLPFILSL